VCVCVCVCVCLKSTTDLKPAAIYSCTVKTGSWTKITGQDTETLEYGGVPVHIWP
jgi:hypothetical protein